MEEFVSRLRRWINSDPNVVLRRSELGRLRALSGQSFGRCRAKIMAAAVRVVKEYEGQTESR